MTIHEDAVLMEVHASTRLFGGKAALRERVVHGSEEYGVKKVAWAPTGLAAHALARCKKQNGVGRPLQDILDGLPMGCLTAIRKHEETLAQTGCRTLGDIRQLPRHGLARRFGKIREAMDRAYGVEPEVYKWEVLPDVFFAKVELSHRVEHSPALLEGARGLLLQMCGWLSGKHAGTTAFTLSWRHDSMAHRDAGAGGQLTVGTADPSRGVEHLARLLAEHLAHVQLSAPAGELALTADKVHEQPASNLSLFVDESDEGEPPHLVLERIAARLGGDKVRRCVVHEDHRAEWAGIWRPSSTPAPRNPASSTDLPQPTWLLAEPMKLTLRNHRPCYQGELQLLAGPQCIEAGWWDRDEVGGRNRLVVRDYWIAESRHAGVLWIFQARLDDGAAWFLHGIFG